MDRRVDVTGLCAVTPLGNDLATSWQAALRGECGIDTVTQFDASILGSQIAGEVKNFDATKYLGVKEVRRFDRFVHFGVAAGIMALEDAGIEVTEELAPEIGVAIGAGIGGIPVITSNYQAMIDRGPRRISPFMIPGCIINMVSGQLAIMKNLKGPNIAHVTACSTGLHAIGEAMHIIRRGDATAMIAGGCESTIHPLAMGAFDAMHALSRGFARLGAPWQITSNVVAPGLILTDLCTVRLTEEELQRECDGIPLGRGASPAEIAETVFTTAANGFMTGEIVNLNGGAFMNA